MVSRVLWPRFWLPVGEGLELGVSSNRHIISWLPCSVTTTAMALFRRSATLLGASSDPTRVACALTNVRAVLATEVRRGIL